MPHAPCAASRESIHARPKNCIKWERLFKHGGGGGWKPSRSPPGNERGTEREPRAPAEKPGGSRLRSAAGSSAVTRREKGNGTVNTEHDGNSAAEPKRSPARPQSSRLAPLSSFLRENGFLVLVLLQSPRPARPVRQARIIHTLLSPNLPAPPLLSLGISALSFHHGPQRKPR